MSVQEAEEQQNEGPTGSKTLSPHDFLVAPSHHRPSHPVPNMNPLAIAWETDPSI